MLSVACARCIALREQVLENQVQLQDALQLPRRQTSLSRELSFRRDMFLLMLDTGLDSSSSRRLFMSSPSFKPYGIHPRHGLLIEMHRKFVLNAMINQNLPEIFDLALEETHIAAWDLSLCEWIIAYAAGTGFFAGFAAWKALVTAVFAQTAAIAGGDIPERLK